MNFNYECDEPPSLSSNDSLKFAIYQQHLQYMVPILFNHCIKILHDLTFLYKSNHCIKILRDQTCLYKNTHWSLCLLFIDARLKIKLLYL